MIAALSARSNWPFQSPVVPAMVNVGKTLVAQSLPLGMIARVAPAPIVVAPARTKPASTRPSLILIGLVLAPLIPPAARSAPPPDLVRVFTAATFKAPLIF